MNDTRFVITRPLPASGLGANLLSLVGGLYLAERTGRHLIVDWTEMEALRDKHTNYFVAFFEPIRRWGSVEIFYVGDDDPSRDVRYPADQAFQVGAQDMPAALAGTLDHPYLYLDAYHYERVFNACTWLTPAARFHYTRTFYRALALRPAVRARLAAARTAFEASVVIGLNVRTGNKHPLWAPGQIYEHRLRQDILERPDFVERAYRACLDCVGRLPREIWAPVKIYVVSDSAVMQRRLLAIPGAFAVRRHHPPAGVSLNFNDFDERQYGAYSDIDSVTETLVDMFLLAECQGLVCNYTEYNRYAQSVTTFFNGNLVNLEHAFEHPVRAIGRRARQWVRRRALPTSAAGAR